MSFLAIYPLLEIDPEVTCVRSCGRVATRGVERGATADGTPVAELYCEPCCDDLEAA